MGIEARAATLARRYVRNRRADKLLRGAREYVRDSQAILSDFRHNRRLTAPEGRILVVRHLHHYHRVYNDFFLAWAAEHAPDFARRMELRRLPCRVRDWDSYALLVPWLQDPLRERHPVDYRRARRLEMQCEEHGIPIINPVDRLSVSIKSVSSRLLSDAGLRTPRMVPITDVGAFRREPDLEPPFFVREDSRHGGPMHLVRSLDEVRTVPIEALERPVAVEFVDVRGDDGLCRKYRYCLFGDRGVPVQLFASPGWVVHMADRVANDRMEAQELDYVNLERDPHHDLFVRGRRALGLDVVAFDYAYDQDGAIVVFEANPFPVLWDETNDAPELGYMHHVRDRLFSELLQFLTERGHS